MKPVDPECLKCHIKSFSSIEDFDDHVLICYGKNSLTVDFICNQNNCLKKKWNSAEVLHYHLFLEHQISDRVCDICGAVVKCPWNSINPLTSHKSRHFSKPTPKSKEHKCGECDKYFSCKARLKSHVDVQHLGIKRFECETCGYRTNEQCRLKDHINIMHKQDPLICKYCDFVCYSKTIKQKHMRKFHKQNIKKIIKIDSF